MVSLKTTCNARNTGARVTWWQGMRYVTFVGCCPKPKRCWFKWHLLGLLITTNWMFAPPTCAHATPIRAYNVNGAQHNSQLPTAPIVQAMYSCDDAQHDVGCPTKPKQYDEALRPISPTRA